MSERAPLRRACGTTALRILRWRSAFASRALASVVVVAITLIGCAADTDYAALDGYGATRVELFRQRTGTGGEIVSLQLQRGERPAADCPALVQDVRVTLSGRDANVRHLGGPVWMRVVQKCGDASFSWNFESPGVAQIGSGDAEIRIDDGERAIVVGVGKYLEAVAISPAPDALTAAKRGTELRFVVPGFEKAVDGGMLDAKLDVPSATRDKLYDVVSLEPRSENGAIVVPIPANVRVGAGARLELRAFVGFETTRCDGVRECTIGPAEANESYELEITD